MQASRLSIIIPTYNERANIAQLLTRLTELPELEIIVSDGGSTDGTREIAAQFPVKLVKSSLGRGRQLNAGVELSTGEVLVFIHADSEVGLEVFSEIAQVVEGGAQWGCCTMCFDSQSLFFRYLAWVSGIRARQGNICFGDQGIFCTRDILNQIGGFPDLPIMEDLELSRRLRSQAQAHVVSGMIITSSRRFVQGGPLRTLGKMQIMKFLFLLGVKPERLAIIYKNGFWEGLWKRPLS